MSNVRFLKFQVIFGLVVQFSASLPRLNKTYNLKMVATKIAVDTARKLNVLKTFRRLAGRLHMYDLMHDQFTSCVQRDKIGQS